MTYTLASSFQILRVFVVWVGDVGHDCCSARRKGIHKIIAPLKIGRHQACNDPRVADERRSNIAMKLGRVFSATASRHHQDWSTLFRQKYATRLVVIYADEPIIRSMESPPVCRVPCSLLPTNERATIRTKSRGAWRRNWVKFSSPLYSG